MQTEPCGCKSNDTHWLVRCPYHAAQDAEYTTAFFERRSARPEREWWFGAAQDLI